MPTGGQTKIILSTAWFLSAIVFIFCIFMITNCLVVNKEQRLYSKEQIDNLLNLKSASPVGIVPVLCYHHIRHYYNPFDPTGQMLSVAPDKFQEQMQWLYDHNFQTITPGQLTEVLNGQLVMDKKPIIITFDDGYENASEEIYPILKHYDFTGVFYVLPGYWQKSDYLKAEDIKFLDDHGMIIGSHSVKHLDFAKLDRVAQYKELLDSKEQIEQLLGHQIDTLAYPFGKYDKTIIEMARKAGYKTAFTIGNKAIEKTDDFLALPRIMMNKDLDLADFLN